jgi:uncharacterized protein (TIGR02246 family)
MPAEEHGEQRMLTITGVTGRTGGAVAESLLARGEEVRAVVRAPRDAEHWRSRGAQVAVADFEDERALTHALADCDALFALLPEDPTAPDFHAHRRRMADALAASVRAACVPHVVFLSSAAAAESAGPGADLRHAEEALGATGCGLTIVRAGYFQENIAAAIAVAKEYGMFASFLPHERVAIPMVAIADVAAAVTAFLLHPSERSEIVDVTGPVYSGAQVAEHLGRALGRSIDVVTIPPPGQVDFLRRVGVPPQLAQALIELYAWLGSRPPGPRAGCVITGTTTLAQTLTRLLQPPPRAERATIAGVVAALTDAWNRHDLEAMGELYRADADFVNIFGGYLRGRDEIVREHTERHKVMFAGARMANTAPMIRSLTPTLALARVAWTMRGITGPDGKPAADREGLMLHVLEQAAGEWSIVTTQNTELAHQAPRRFLDLLAAS